VAAMTTKSIFSETHIAAYETKAKPGEGWKGYIWIRRQGEEQDEAPTATTDEFAAEDEALFAAELIARDRLRELSI
jgi:hypothetical protein